jgi:hypothetical protein
VRRLRTQFFVAVALAVALHLATPAFGRVYYNKIVLTMTTGTSVRFTSTTTIQSRKVTIQNSIDSAATVYIGDSTLAGATTAFCSLAPGMAITFTPSKFHDDAGERYRLSDYYARGTTGDRVYVIYELRATP